MAPPPAATADVVVFGSEDGTVVAQSGRTGAAVASGRDAASVIQQAIDSLPAEGGKVYIAAGCYWLDSTVRIEDKHGVRLEGAARGIVFSQGREGTVLRSNRDIDLLEIFGNKLKITGITISNLHLIGSGRANGRAGLLVRGGTDLLSLHNVGANHCGIGFHLRGGDGETPGVIDAPSVQFCDPQVNGVGLKIERSHYAKIVGGEFADCVSYGMHLSSPDSGHARLQGVKLIGVTAVRNGEAGILIGRNAEDITVAAGSDVGGTRGGSGVVISDEGSGDKPTNIILNAVHSYNNSRAGISVESARHVVIQGCICSAHDHVCVDDLGQEYGIHIKRTSEDVLCQGNLTYANKKQGVLDEAAEAHGADDSGR